MGHEAWESGLSSHAACLITHAAPQARGSLIALTSEKSGPYTPARPQFPRPSGRGSRRRRPSMPFEEVKKVWMNGKLVDFADAKIHVFTHALHYGSGLFEGIRCYVTKNNGPAVFRLDEHTRRLFHSCRI